MGNQGGMLGGGHKFISSLSSASNTPPLASLAGSSGGSLTNNNAKLQGYVNILVSIPLLPLIPHPSPRISPHIIL